jgi:hypothetical protein
MRVYNFGFMFSLSLDCYFRLLICIHEPLQNLMLSRLLNAIKYLWAFKHITMELIRNVSRTLFATIIREVSV